MKQGKIWLNPKYKCLFKEVPGEPGQLLCLPTLKKVWEESDGRNGGHDATGMFLAKMKQHMLAVDIFGRFDMTAVPKDPNRVPTLEEIQKGYGERVPAYDRVSSYLPVNVRLTNGKAQSWVTFWPCPCVMAMGVVFWDGTGGVGHFRQKTPQGPLEANWAKRSADDGHLCVRVPCVYEDPKFSSTSRVQAEKKVEGTGTYAQEAKKIQEHTHMHISRERENTYIA